MVRASSIALVCSILGACSATTTVGSVDGERVNGARSAAFDQVAVDIPFLGERSVGLVMIADVPDVCSTFEDIVASLDASCESTCEGLVALRDELRGDDHWSVSLVVVGDGDLLGDYDYSNVPLAGDFSASFSSLDFTAARDLESCEALCNEGDDPLPTDTQAASGGSLEITAADDERLLGSFEIELDGDDALKGAFRATPCDLADVLL